ncbi:MAG: hypothetical protein M1827_004186 [Pycnora praestabilis]|nr:MAG: hypothetical protein M1827_004186 [Pycnora praestabilis]
MKIETVLHSSSETETSPSGASQDSAKPTTSKSDNDAGILVKDTEDADMEGVEGSDSEEESNAESEDSEHEDDASVTVQGEEEVGLDGEEASDDELKDKVEHGVGTSKRGNQDAGRRAPWRRLWSDRSQGDEGEPNERSGKEDALGGEARFLHTRNRLRRKIESEVPKSNGEHHGVSQEATFLTSEEVSQIVTSVTRTLDDIHQISDVWTEILRTEIDNTIKSHEEANVGETVRHGVKVLTRGREFHKHVLQGMEEFDKALDNLGRIKYDEGLGALISGKRIT